MCRCWRVATSTCSRPETRGEIQRSWLGSALSKTRRDGPCGPPRLIFSRCTSSPTRRGLAPSPARAALLFFSENSKDAVSQKHVALVSDAKSSTYTRELGSISCARSAFFFKRKKWGSQSETCSTRLRREEQHVRTRAWLHLLRAQRLFFFGLVRSLGRGNQSETHVALRRPRLPLRAQHSLCVGNIAECHTQETRFSGRCVTGKTEIFSAAASGPRSGISAAAAKLHGSNPPRLDSSSTRAGQR